MSKRRLFLGGGGDENSATEIDDLYGTVLGVEAQVLYLPVAWELTSTTNYETCLAWFAKAYERFNFHIEMRTDLNGCNYDYLKRFDSVYLGGGNTFLLLQKLKESGFIDVLCRYINSGKVVYGGSAGAIVLGKDINTASLGACSDKNTVGIHDLSGLDMVNDFAIHCHYKKESCAEVKEFSKKQQLNILALTEEGGVYVEGNTINYIGEVTSFVSGY